MTWWVHSVSQAKVLMHTTCSPNVLMLTTTTTLAARRVCTNTSVHTTTTTHSPCGGGVGGGGVAHEHSHALHGATVSKWMERRVKHLQPHALHHHPWRTTQPRCARQPSAQHTHNTHGFKCLLSGATRDVGGGTQDQEVDGTVRLLQDTTNKHQTQPQHLLDKSTKAVWWCTSTASLPAQRQPRLA